MTELFKKNDATPHVKSHYVINAVQLLFIIINMV